MAEVNTRELKTHLSRYLRDVERGEPVTVTRRGKPIAVISPAPNAGASEEGWARLIATGMVHGSGKFEPPKRGVKMRKGGPSVDEIVAWGRGDPLPRHK
jgi:prevent-host-death family protein